MTAALPMRCPEQGCSGTLVLRQGRWGPFYGCSSFPRCSGAHGAHHDGRPLGIPAPKAVRAARMKAHEAFDRLWKGPGAPMRRGAAYRALAKAMGVSVIHIGEADAEQCERITGWALGQLQGSPAPGR